MYIALSGQWNVYLEAEEGPQSGPVELPGILQAQGYGSPITKDTPWISSLHDAFWFEQEEYKNVQQDECLVPFLSQPPRHFMGKAFYEREFEITEQNDEAWSLRIELTQWRTDAWIDGEYMGGDCSLCTAHEIPCGKLAPGKHQLKVCVDNSMQYPYRPDGHGVSDALGRTWNGMAGQICLETESEKKKRQKERKDYAQAHPRKVEVIDGNFYIDGVPEFFRGTHFGGEYPLTGYPVQDKSWWQKIMRVIKEWGLNGIRCHSYCPPEIAFQTADEEGIYLLVECAMWNIFNEGNEMLEILRKESRRILEEFGHHPSFVFFSPSNEPGGNWYQPLRDWVKETKEYDAMLGYEGRRLCTAQSGWFYDVPTAEIEGTDFIYFHRSAYGPFLGGRIRGEDGWWGADYRSSMEGCKLPVLSHELGQWCAYPDYRIIDKFKGYLRGGNFEVYQRHAGKQGLLDCAEDMCYASGRQQLRLYKEDLEATFRTPQIKGFELLDLHDYLGQGTALVGLLDAFWEEKGYAKPEDFRKFCGESVLLIRCPSYVWTKADTAVIPVEIAHYGKKPPEEQRITWKLTDGKNIYASGCVECPAIICGGNTEVGAIEVSFSDVPGNSRVCLELSMGQVQNTWDMYVFEAQAAEADVVYTHEWEEAKAVLADGGKVVYSPWMSQLDYECPVLSWRSVFWNSQMGPTWSRNLGLVVDEDHPIFRDFPSDKSGGWQWMDILNHARGFHLKGMEHIKPIVRTIDDWNRSLPLALIFEAKVGQGSLLVVSADLDVAAEENPAAYCLKQAILKYASGEEFNPQESISAADIEDKFFPILRMQELVESYEISEETKVRRGDALFSFAPQASARLERENFPVTIGIQLKKEITAQGMLYVPEQGDRGHEGFLREYSIQYLDKEDGSWKEAARGKFLNTSLSQKVLFSQNICADKWQVVVYSCYGCVDKEVWQDTFEGWEKTFVPQKAVLQIAGLHMICNEEIPGTNDFAYGRVQKTKTKEIEQ